MTVDTLRSLALRTLMPGFSGTKAPQWALELLGEGLGGYTLFAYNVTHPEQLTELSAELRNADPNVLVGIDEEGGDVTRLHATAGSPFPGNAALGAVDDPGLTRTVHAQIGAELAAAGVTLNLAPVADVNVEETNPVIGTRSFGADPRLVARHTAAAVSGLQDAGVAACAKHFPGHGATAADSHHTLPVVDVPPSVLHERELPPFAAAIEAGCRAIMSGHIRVPTLTGDTPATLSGAAMRDLLRDRLGFTGTVVTDALEMRGVSAGIGVPEAAVRALAAGCDLICTGGEMQKRGPLTDLVHQTVAAIVMAVQTGRLPEERLVDAAARVDALRDWVRRHPGTAPSESVSGEVARRALRVEGTPPALTDPVIVQIDAPANIAVGADTYWGVTPLLAKRLPGSTIRHVTTEATDQADAVASAAGRDAVVVCRGAHRHPGAQRLITGLIGVADTVTVVEMGWPGSSHPAGLTCHIFTYGATRVNSEAAAQYLLGDA